MERFEFLLGILLTEAMKEIGLVRAAPWARATFCGSA